MAIKREYKPKRCKNCGATYTPRKMGQKVCGMPCGIEWGRKERVKARQKQQKAKDKETKERLKTIGDHKAETQVLFNKYIRLRDHRKPCISCGQPPGTFQRHAGHYRTRAAAPQLSFCFTQVWGQCAQCNNSKSGNITEYRIALVKILGEDGVQAIENNNEFANFTVEYLKRLQGIMRRRIAHYKRLRNL